MTEPVDTSEQGATYVYGIVDAKHPCRLDEITGVGEPPRPLRRLDAGKIVAIISDAPAELRAKRRDVLAHQRVLDEIIRQGTVLPMRFGVIAQDEESLRDDLVDDADADLAMIDELRGRIEFNVKAFADEDALLNDVATTDESVRRLRGRGTTTVEDQIELGEAVAAAIEVRHEAIRGQLVENLGRLAVRSVPGSPVREAAANQSFLVERHRTPDFTAAVDALDTQLGANVRLQCVGPLPPYSFVEPGEPGEE
jgi:hypothetical protein